MELESNMGLSECLYTKNLYDLCTLNGCKPDGKKKHDIKSIRECLYSMKDYLMKAYVRAKPYEEPLIQLTGIEIAAAEMCSNSLLRKEWETALKDLSECIYNRGEGVKEDRLMNYAEYIIYLLIINNFLGLLDSQDPIVKRKGNVFTNYKESIKARDQARKIIYDYLNYPEHYTQTKKGKT